MKASEQVQYVKNPNGPVIGTVSRQIIERDGLYFKDIDGSGVFQPFDDWRLPPQERAASLVRVLTTKEKLGQLFISDWRMGRDQSDPAKRDDSGLLDEGTFTGKTIFGEQTLPGTTTLIRSWWARHLILRANPRPEELADFVNQLNAVAEACARFVPVQLASNSRNESGKAVFGMNDATGVFTAWPGTLGIAAAIIFYVVFRFAIGRRHHPCRPVCRLRPPPVGCRWAEKGLHVHGRCADRSALAAVLRHIWRG